MNSRIARGRAKILNKVVQVHKAGYQLRDFAERNVLKMGDDYRLIDLEHTGKHKCCSADYDFSQAEDEEPLGLCRELGITSADDMDFWREGMPSLALTTHAF